MLVRFAILGFAGPVVGGEDDGEEAVRGLHALGAVDDVGDLQGLRLRTAHMRILNRPWVILGAAAVPMAMTEIYMGLQQGTIEGQENPLLTSLAGGFHEIQRYITNTEHVHGIVGFVWNRAYFQSLPREYQDIIRQASNEVSQWRNRVEAEAQASYIQRSIDMGLELIQLRDLDQWKAALAEPLRQDFPELQAWVNRIREFNRAGPH